MYVDYTDGEFTLGLGCWHGHYDLYRKDYEDLLNDIENILNNLLVAVTIRCDGEWYGSWKATVSECSKKELIIQAREIMHKELIEKTKKNGYQLECEFFNKSKDFIYRIDPEI